jgi:hypothetical protein
MCFILMEAGVHEIAANVIFMFVYNGLNTLCGVFIIHLLLKARGCCMHVFSSILMTYCGIFLVKVLQSSHRISPKVVQLLLWHDTPNV